MTDDTPISRRTVLASAGSVLGASALGASLIADESHGHDAARTRRSPANTPADAPNIIMVMTDDQGYGDVSANGNPTLQTPALDRFRQEGAHFENFHTNTVCSPTRASLLTGQHNLRAGVTATGRMDEYLRLGIPTLANYFGAAGYRTALIGKWHLGDAYPYRPVDRGFDHVLRCGGGGIGQTPDYWGNTHSDNKLLLNGEHWRHFHKHPTATWFSSARDFVENTSLNSQPFFLYLPTTAPHHPFAAPDKWTKRFDRDRWGDDTVEFYGMIEQLDHWFGVLMRRLETLGIAENTIVLFFGDNGHPPQVRGYNAGMRGYKGQPYEGGHRNALFMRYPRTIPTNHTVSELSTVADLAPTLLDLALGANASAVLKASGFDGDSLRPLLAKKRVSDVKWADRYGFISTQSDESTRFHQSAVMQGTRWRLINGDELYDLTRDPGQRRNLAKRYPNRVKRMRDRFDVFWYDATHTERNSDGPHFRISHPGHGNSVTITAMDWMLGPDDYGGVPFPQTKVSAAKRGIGYWPIEVPTGEDGRYVVELRRWPPEIYAPIRGVPARGDRVGTPKRLNVTRAELEVDGSVKSRRNLGDRQDHTTMPVHLSPGTHTIRGRFYNPNDASQERGPYYAVIRSD